MRDRSNIGLSPIPGRPWLPPGPFLFPACRTGQSLPLPCTTMNFSAELSGARGHDLRVRFPRRLLAVNRCATPGCGSACGVAISRHNEDLPCACEMLSSHATRKHLRTELGRSSSEPIPWKRGFASSHREVLRTYTQPLRSATSALRGTASDLRCASRPVVALRSPSLRFELTSVHGELASGQRAPALDDYTLGRNRREARTRHSEVARGAAKSYRALRANFQCSSAASVTFRASSRRCEKASSQASNLRHHACSDAAAGAGYHGVEARIQSMRARGAYTELSRGSAKLGRRHGEAVRGAVCSHVLKQSSRVASVNRYR